jgi:hypothetical protein
MTIPRANRREHVKVSMAMPNAPSARRELRAAAAAAARAMTDVRAIPGFATPVGTTITTRPG